MSSIFTLGKRRDCYYATDPRQNKELAKSLDSQNVLVTGAGRGVGRATAQFLTYASAKSLTVVALEQAELDETVALGAHANIAGMGSYTLDKLGQVKLSELIHTENYKDRSFAYHPGVIRTRFYTDFEGKVKGNQGLTNSYADDGMEGQDKSARTAYDALHDAPWMSPEMAAGLVTALAAGKLDFMAGRFLDASIDIEKYIQKTEEIVEQDLHRVRLHLDSSTFIPKSDF